MPKKARKQQAKKQPKQQPAMQPMPRMPKVPKMRHQVAEPSDKIRTTEVSNIRGNRALGASTLKQSEMAAVGILDPFAAFQRQYKTGLPFSTMTMPSFGFWTRTVTRLQEIQWGTTAQAGINLNVNPWLNPLFLEATALDAAGKATTTVAGSDPQLTFITANFESIVVAYQGVRVRNLTPVLNQGGELVIGNASHQDGLVNDFNQIRSSSTTITHSNGDPGVIAQASFYGNPNDSDSQAIATILDYRFNDATLSSVDDNTRIITVRSYGINSAPQIFEIEIVTYYLGVPFGIPSQIFAPVRYEVNPVLVNRLLDRGFSESPMYCIPRNFIKDDGWDTVWTGVKSIIKDIGLGLIGSAASAVGSAFAGLFAAKHRGAGFRRLLALLPPDAYPDFRKLMVEHETHSSLLHALKPVVRNRRFTPEEMAQIAKFMGFENDDEDTLSSTAAQPASTLPGALPALARACSTYVKR